MKKWEYLVRSVPLRDYSIEGYLAKRGEEGWELIYFTESSTNAECVFKREKEETQVTVRTRI